MTRALMLASLLLTAPLTAQQPVLFGPDSAEYTMSMESQFSGSAASQHLRALVTASPIGSDSLLVRVSVLEHNLGGTGEGMQPRLAQPAELRIARTGFDARELASFARREVGMATIFAALVFGGEPPVGLLAELRASADSLTKLGVEHAQTFASLPDTVIGGARITRKAIDMEMTAMKGIPIPEAPGGMSPPMHLRVHTERWVSDAGRLFRATLRNESLPLPGNASSQPTGPIGTTTMLLERVGAP